MRSIIYSMACSLMVALPSIGQAEKCLNLNNGRLSEQRRCSGQTIKLQTSKLVALLGSQVDLADFQGDSGEKGPPGEAGPQGAQGDVGVAGARGPNGIMGLAGAEGPIGPSGLAGSPGTMGPQGPQGARGATAANMPKGCYLHSQSRQLSNFPYDYASVYCNADIGKHYILGARAELFDEMTKVISRQVSPGYDGHPGAIKFGFKTDGAAQRTSPVNVLITAFCCPVG